MTDENQNHFDPDRPIQSDLAETQLESGSVEPVWLDHRMPNWEDDFSLNHGSWEPFRNLPAPSEMGKHEFKVWSQLTPELLAGRPLDQIIEKDTYPIPASEDREYYSANYHAAYFLNGFADYLKILGAAERAGLEIDAYFDFGCASGRVLRHFCAQSEVSEIWGSDINGRHIRWLNDYLPQKLKTIHNHCIPCLPMADRSMDLISAFSVFTHIDTFETAWLAELYRILRPGGLVYLTVQNDASWKALRESGKDQPLVARMLKWVPNLLELLESDLPNRRLDFRHTPRGPYRGVVFHSDDYLRRTWGRFFRILEIRPLDHGTHQSVFIGQKI
jgi:SAM-dependent methyltransferase